MISAQWLTRMFCVWIITCQLVAVSSVTPSIPSLYVRGSHYEVGFQTGQYFKGYIEAYNNDHPYLRPVWLPWSQTQQGRKVVKSLLEAAQKYVPQYVSELHGLADGASISFNEMFLANHAVELSALLATSGPVPDSCSDILLNNPSTQSIILGHNEDNSPLIQNKAYILTATITDNSGKILEQFTAYCYPGQIPGNAFGYNHHGIVTTVNGLYPIHVVTNKVGRSFLNRAMLSSSSMKDAISRAHIPSAYGFSCNVGECSQTPGVSALLYNIEVTPRPYPEDSIVNVLQVLPPTEAGGENTSTTYFHVNMYRRISTEEIPSRVVSSQHRTKRIKQLGPPKNMKDILHILSDDTDNLYPIYRSPRPTDNETTLATAIFDLGGCVLNIYTDRAATSRGALVQLPLPCV